MRGDVRSFAAHGFGAVRPYVYGYADSLALIERAFGGTILERVDRPNGAAHIEVRVDDSVVVLEMADTWDDARTRASIYVYVRDVDAAHAAALACGASEIDPPRDKPYDERASGVRDVFGNVWYIATYRGRAEPTTAVPAGTP